MNLVIDTNAKQIADGMRRFPGVVEDAIARAMDYENAITVGQTQRKRLSFSRSQQPTKEGLRKISGRLFDSANPSPAKVLGPGHVESDIGATVPYAFLHEFGGTVNVGSYVRSMKRITHGMRQLTLRRAYAEKLITKKGVARKGKVIEESEHAVPVRGHDRTYTARRMFSRTLEERADKYTSTMSRFIGRALQAAATGPA